MTAQHPHRPPHPDSAIARASDGAVAPAPERRGGGHAGETGDALHVRRRSNFVGHEPENGPENEPELRPELEPENGPELRPDAEREEEFFEEPDLASFVPAEPAPPPKRHRSTFTTERVRPASRRPPVRADAIEEPPSGSSAPERPASREPASERGGRVAVAADALREEREGERMPDAAAAVIADAGVARPPSLRRRRRPEPSPAPDPGDPQSASDPSASDRLEAEPPAAGPATPQPEPLIPAAEVPDPHVSPRLTRRQRRALAASAPTPDAEAPDAAGAGAEGVSAPAPITRETVPGDPESAAGDPESVPGDPESAPGDPESAAAQDVERLAPSDGDPASEGLEPSPVPEDAAPRHALTRRAARLRMTLGIALIAGVVLTGTVAVTAAVAGTTDPADRSADGARQKSASLQAVEASARVEAPLPALAESIPVPEVSTRPAYVDVCAIAGFPDAIATRDDAGAIALAGGGEPFRAAVAAGLAPCVPLDDPAHAWVVVNKQRPFDPVDYYPDGLATPPGVRDLADSPLRAEAGSALGALVAAAKEAGAGEIAISSAFRSYGIQKPVYGSLQRARGTEGADLVSARPGFSEHQSGLATDVVACSGGGCGTLDDLAGTPQDEWIVAHSWEFGWIVRYEEGQTDVSGYSPEPWHLRYIGPDLAAAYHDGGWHTLEEFFGLPAAPDYVD